MIEGLQLRRLPGEAIDLIGQIDRAEFIDVNYTVSEGRLIPRAVAFDVPAWDPIGRGEHSVARLVAEAGPLVRGGAQLLGAYVSEALAGLAIVDPRYEPQLAWLAFLHVSRRYRRQGVASLLWESSVQLAREHGARSVYVSATPSGSAVGFYLSRGCVLADPPDPYLLAKEPEDIHLICPLV